MRVLIDTNVLIDYIAKRQPYYYEAEKILVMCSEGELNGFVAAHSITNAFYILRKYSLTEIREVLTEMCNIMTVVGIDKERLMVSLCLYRRKFILKKRYPKKKAEKKA